MAKTTTAVSEAHALARQGSNVLLIDTDSQGSCALCLGMDPEACLVDLFTADTHINNLVRHTNRPGLHLLPSNSKTRSLLRTLDAGLENGTVTQAGIAARFDPLVQMMDYLVFDTSPSGALQEAALGLAHVIIIPTALDNLSMNGAAHLLESVTSLNPAARLIILPTLYDGRLTEHRYNLTLLQENYGDRLAPAVAYSSAIREAIAYGQTIYEYNDPQSSTLPKVRMAYDDLCARLIARN
ncbi:MAG TPA: ParA family protein [Caldilineaceae bacterium]|nr:ParA family protein [Caldilineaceae bacterium]